MTEVLRVGITGSSGLIGTALRRHLTEVGHSPVPIVRRVARSGEIEWDPAAGRLSPDAISDLDVIVNLAGAGIGSHRWSESYRQQILSSRVDGTRLLATTLAALGDDGPRALVSASAIGFYGDRGDEVLDERSPSGDGFLASVCRDWEAAASEASHVTRVVHLRTGIVLSRDGGALAKMLPMFRFWLGGRFGDGNQWMSWITLHDEVRAIVAAVVDGDLSGPVNLTAPNPVTNREFASALGDALHRPSLLPVPGFGPRLVLGGEMADALLFDSARILPTALEARGFAFDHPTLAEGLAAVLPR
jgi:uncharacterized protein (TIGR01777 family)